VEKVAAAVMFLVSSQAFYIAGANLAVCGGRWDGSGLGYRS